MNFIQKSVGIGILGAMPREGATSDSLPLDQSESFTDNRYMPVGGDEFLSHSYGDVNIGSPQEGVACGTGDSHQSDFNVTYSKRIPVKWRSLTESINQSRAFDRSSFPPREGYANLTKVLSQSEKRCSKSIKSPEGDRTCDHARNQSDLRFNFTPSKGQNK